MEKRHNIYDIAAWVAFGIVVLYFFLKIIGVLKSPVTFDIMALLSAAYFVGRRSQKMDEYTKKLDKYTRKFDDYTKRFGDHTRKFDISLKDIKLIKGDLKSLDRKCPVFAGIGTKTR